MELGFCYECREITYLPADSNGVFEKQKLAQNHQHCKNKIVFGTPNKYPAPIRLVLTKLQAMAPISDNEIILFKLALDLEDNLKGK